MPARPLLPLVLTVAAAGCGQPPAYPPDLVFAPRADRLVLLLPAAAPPDTGVGGPVDVELARLDALGGRTLDPAAVPADARAALGRFLADTFGTPAAPRVEIDGAGELGLTPDRLAEGGRLFRRHCLHCHGLTGDGDGPSGQRIHPRPRDFRRGAFKFVSSGDGGKPRRADLRRTLRDGLKGSAMPPFGLLPDETRELLAGYVVYLSVRGQVEFRTLAALSPDADDPPDDVAGFAREQLTAALDKWRQAEAAPPGPSPPPTPDDAGKQDPEYLAGVRRGYELFTAANGAGCLACHEDFGRKDVYRFDVWGTAVRPKNLTEPGFKGGDRFEDLYQRVRHGVQPVGMPSHPGLTDSQVWDVVRFVKALPYPRELPADVRARVYP